MSWLTECYPHTQNPLCFKKIKFSLESHHLLFVPETGEAQGQVEHGGGVERAAGKLQWLRKEKQKNYSAANLEKKKVSHLDLKEHQNQ